MQLNKRVIVNSIVVIICLVGVFVAGKVFLRVYRDAQKPKRYNAQGLVDKLKGPAVGPELAVFVASSLDKVFQDGMTAAKPTFSASASIAAAGHEYESFQIVIYPKSKDFTAINVSTSDLVNEKLGLKIDKSNFTWRKVGYIPTETPYYSVKYVGLWPDPLMPVTTFDVKAGTRQPIWLEVYVPAQTPAGEYTGTVTIKGDGFAPQTVPVKLRVYGFTLPVESRLKTAFDHYGSLTKMRFPQGERESEAAWMERINVINDKFIVEMLKHRMNPILNVDPSNQWELGNVDRYRVLGLTNFSIGKRGGTFNNNWPKDEDSIEGLLDLYRQYGENLKLNKMLEYTYIYTWDEGNMGNPTVSKITSMIHRAYPGLKNMVCYHGFWDVDSYPDWGKDIDIWTFQIDNFVEEKLRRLQKMGVEMWMYISGPANTTSPNLAIDFDSIGYRIVPWMCWKYDIKGFLYWSVNYWPFNDPFKTGRNAQWDQNGNGLLFYPGEDGPMASIRTEVYRDGMEDYEYIQTLVDKLRILRAQKQENNYKEFFEQSVKLVMMDAGIVESIWSYVQDGNVLEARRNAIAAKIEEFNTAILPKILQP